MLKRTLFWFPMLLLCPLSRAWADDWPQWRGPDRTGVSKEKGLLDSWPADGPKLLWTFRDAGVGHSGMCVIRDRLYSMGGFTDGEEDGGQDCVYAVDLKTQKKLWTAEVGKIFQAAYGRGPRSTPTVDGGLIYALSGHGCLACVDTASGKKIWSNELISSLGGEEALHGFCYSPLVDGDLVIVSTCGKEGVVAAFGKKTGRLQWCTSVGAEDSDRARGATYASMIAIEAGGVRQYVHVPAGEGIAGLRASDGKQLWKFAQKKEPFAACNTPIWHNDCLYVTYGYNTGCELIKLTAAGGKFKTELVYSGKNMLNLFHSVVLVDGWLYGYFDNKAGKAGWACQNFQSGKTVWMKNPDLGPGVVVCADSNLYCYHEEQGDVLLLGAVATGYNERGRFHIPEGPKRKGWIWSQPVVANGKLFLRDQELIFCYDIRKPPSLPLAPVQPGVFAEVGTIPGSGKSAEADPPVRHKRVNPKVISFQGAGCLP